MDSFISYIYSNSKIRVADFDEFDKILGITIERAPPTRFVIDFCNKHNLYFNSSPYFPPSIV